MADIEKLDLRMAGERTDDAVKTCPFCGSKNIAYGEYEHSAGKRYAILCMNCMAQIDPGWAQSWGAVQELWNRRARPENKPLTLEELKAKAWEPVYIVSLSDHSDDGYGIVHMLDSGEVFVKVRNAEGGMSCYEEDCGKDWLAYTRKPEGSHT